MLEAFKRFIKPNSGISKGDEPEGILTHQGQIQRLLERVIEGRLHLSVNIPREDRRYTSALLQFGPRNNSIILDELNPPSGHEELLRAKRLRVLAMLDGVELIFITRLLEVGGSDGIAFYRMDLPKKVLYKQRRQHHRVRVGAGMNLSFSTYSSQAQKAVKGQLIDISQGGVGAAVDRSATFTNGEHLGTCSLRLPNNEIVTFGMDIRFIAQELGKLHIGGEYGKLDRKARDRLEKFVRQLEREELKRHSRQR